MVEGDKEKGKRGSLCELWFLHVSWAALNMRSGISGAVLGPTLHSFPLFHQFPELSHASGCLEL